MTSESFPGETLVTTEHDVIKEWAQHRDATPAMVAETEHDEYSALRFDFPGFEEERLEPVRWQEWQSRFDEQELEFVYQEHRSDEEVSYFYRLRKRGKSSA